MNLEKLIGLGEKLGHTGEKLQDFVQAQIQRTEKAEAVRLEREEKAEAARLEREERALERKEKAKEREFLADRERLELEKQRLDQQLEIERLRGSKTSITDTSGISNNHHSSIPKAPKMPPFDDAKDNIDAYLQRFERIANAQSWHEPQWATYLSTLLKGKALDVYCRMPPEDAMDYQALKKELLKRYEMTEEGFHAKFRNAKRDSGNISGAREPDQPDLSWHEPEAEQTNAVESREQMWAEDKGMKPLPTMLDVGITLTRPELIDQQQDDPGLAKLRELADQGQERQTGKNKSLFMYEEGVMCRKFSSPNVEHGKVFNQIVVPSKLRPRVMKFAHVSSRGEHLGARKSLSRIQSYVYWPGLSGDVRRHCAMCDLCQRTIPKGIIGKVLVRQIPLLETLCERRAVIGSLTHVTEYDALSPSLETKETFKNVDVSNDVSADQRDQVTMLLNEYSAIMVALLRML